MTFFQICVLAVCGVIFSMVLKSVNSPMGTCIIAFVALIIGGFLVSKLGNIISQMKKLLEFASIDKMYIQLLFKVIGMTYITHFTSALLKDHGYNAASGLLELLCRVSVAALSIPIVLALFETVNQCI